MSKVKPVQMPDIITESFCDDYITIYATSPHHIEIDNIVYDFWESCLHTEINMANPDDTKQTIFNKAKTRLGDILDKGERYCILLNSALAHEALEGMTFSSKPKQVRTFSKVCSDFAEWWTKNPQKHNAQLLAEYLWRSS